MGALKMNGEMTISRARSEITALPRRFSKRPEAVTVTRRGKPVLAIMPWELYESIVETLEIMGDEEMMDALKKSIRDIKNGRVHTSDEIKRELGL